MWKCFSLGNGSVQCLFLSFGIKNIAKSLAVSGIMLTFAVRVGADGKERLR